MKKHRAFNRLGMISMAVLAFAIGPAFGATGVQAEQAAPRAAHADGAGPTDAMRAIDARVAGIKKAVPGMTRHEVMLKPADLAGITEAGWVKLHSYSTDGRIERIKVYPPTAQTKTEKFYYDQDRLILVLHEPNGMEQEGRDPEAEGKRYYFNAQGLFAIDEASRSQAALDAADRAMGEKLQRVSAKLLALAGGQARKD